MQLKWWCWHHGNCVEGELATAFFFIIIIIIKYNNNDKKSWDVVQNANKNRMQ